MKTEDTRTLKVERSTSTAHRLTHYDGVCGNMHGHNMEWHAVVTVSMHGVGDDNMPLDLKEIADVIDSVDHAVVLNEYDPLVEAIAPLEEVTLDSVLGDYIIFEGDPTCEVLAHWMARQIYEASDAVQHVDITVHETSKYGLGAEYGLEEARRENGPRMQTLDEALSD